MPKKKTARRASGKPIEEVPKFRIVDAESGKPVYADKGGMTEDMANRLSRSLIAKTRVVPLD